MSSAYYRPWRDRPKEVLPHDWRRDQTVRMKRRERQLNWLREARHAGIRLQVEGGAGYGKDLRDLVSRGLLQLRRVTKGISLDSWSCATLLVTDKGLAAISSGKI